MRKLYREPHFWMILTIMACGAFFYYAEELPPLAGLLSSPPFDFVRYSTYRILSLTPVAYAAFVYGWRGGMVTAVIVGLALLPKAIIQTIQVEAITETIAFFFIGLLVTWLIYRQQRSVQQLEDAKETLQANVEVIRANEKQLDILHRMSDTISATLDINAVINSAIDNVVEVMQAEAAWIYLLDEDGQTLSLATHRGINEELAAGTDHLKVGEDLNGLVAQTGRPMYVENASQDVRVTRKVLNKYGLGSTLIVPIASKRQVNGTLCIAMFRLRIFPPQEVELITAMGNQIGIAVENAALYRQQQAVTQQLRLSEEQYRGIFENSSDALFVCSNDARIISVNLAGEQLTGRSQQELVYSDFVALFTGETQERIRHIFSRRAPDIPTGSIGEVTVTRKDGSEAVVELKVSPMLRKRETVGLQILAQDITEEKLLRQNMEYYIRQVTRAQEDERLRLSRELHDDTAQVLANLSRGIDAVVTTENACSDAVNDRLRALHRMADAALEGVRRYSQDLRPSILDDLGLVPALEWLITDLEQHSPISAAFTSNGERSRLSPEQELAVFRVAQEVLSNVRRHSRAGIVAMRVDFSDADLTLRISDDGVGFTVPERASDLAKTGQLGIIGMQERARLVGGTLEVDSVAGVGTTVTLTVPR